MRASAGYIGVQIIDKVITGFRQDLVVNRVQYFVLNIEPILISSSILDSGRYGQSSGRLNIADRQ